LAEQLIADARTHDKKPMPVVFNLSSWVATRKTLQGWLIDELNLKYQIPKRVGKKWVEGEKLLLLLDGFDEVIEVHRAECLDAINAFRADYRSVDMVLCSRIAEYEAPTNKLDLRGAITLHGCTNSDLSR
jgi:predicted NACHT family NTPase